MSANLEAVEVIVRFQAVFTGWLAYKIEASGFCLLLEFSQDRRREVF
jgi:hypothetical protein